MTSREEDSRDDVELVFPSRRRTPRQAKGSLPLVGSVTRAVRQEADDQLPI